jgi:prephenate dehydrogenase
MCGKETSGLASIDSSLYEGATYVLTPLARTSSDALNLTQELVQAVGAHPLFLEASHHDMLVAAISHLPYLAATGLVATAESLDDDALWDVVASGFHDTSRLAASDTTMMLDILLTNRVAVRQALTRFRNQLANLDCLLETGDEAALRAALAAAAQRRRRLFQ